MDYNIIKTGSHGNCVLLDSFAAIDMGVTYKHIQPFEKKLQLVLLTHIHSDHFNPATLRKLHDRRPGVRFVCCSHLLVPLCTEAKISPNNITVLEPGQKAVFHHLPCGDLTVQPFPLVHNVPNTGWLLSSSRGTVMYATDTQYIPISAPGLDLYLVECNYKGDELDRRKERKLSEGKFIYEDTVAVCHMSFETVMAWLQQNATPHSRVVFLHQHIEKEVSADG